VGGQRFDGWISIGSGHTETRIKEFDFKTAAFLHNAALGWSSYHFHDTSETAGVRRQGALNVNEYLRPDGSNLASFLYLMKKVFAGEYARIRDAVRLAAPFFDDFKLRPVPVNPELIQLEWLQRNSDYPFLPSQLSDGTLRFACLATALLQPHPLGVSGSARLFDERSLGCTLMPWYSSAICSSRPPNTGNSWYPPNRQPFSMNSHLKMSLSSSGPTASRFFAGLIPPSCRSGSRSTLWASCGRRTS